MDLIDRYLAAVRRHLPRALQDDIVQELSDNLRSEAEEREQEAGRALTAEDQAALLKKHGHPWLAASRYLPQQQLIGAALFPYYRQALTMVVFWVVLPITIFGGAIAAIYSDHPGQAWVRVLGSAWNGAIYSVGIVTIVFAVLERERVRITALDNWNPLKLPDLGAGRSVPRSETIPGLIAMLTFLVWWTGLVQIPEFTEYAGLTVRFVAAPIWNEIYFPVLISVLAGVAVSFVDLVRPWRTLTMSIVDMAVNGLNAVVIGMLIKAGRYVEVLGSAEHADRITRANQWINSSISWTLIVLGAVVLLDILYELWLISRGTGARRTMSARTI